MEKVKKMKCPKIKGSDFEFLTENLEGYLDEDEDPDGEQNESNYCDHLEVWRPLRDFYSSIKVGDLVTTTSLIGDPTLICISREVDGDEDKGWEYVLTLEFTDTNDGSIVTLEFGTYDGVYPLESGFKSEVTIRNAQREPQFFSNVPLTLKLC